MERNVSCLNTRAVIEYVRRYYPDFLGELTDNLDPFFDDIDDVIGYLTDEHIWVSQLICAEMFRRVREYSGDPEIARSIGHETVMNRRFGYIENIVIKAFGHPHLSILRAPSLNMKFNATKTVKIVEADWSHAVVRFYWHEGLGSTKDICLFNQGIYEAFPTIWGYPPAKGTERCCAFDGSPYCEHSFTWNKRKSLFSMVAHLFARENHILKDSLTELEQEKVLLETKYREVEDLNIQLNTRIEQLTSLDSCSKATASILDIDRLMDIVTSLVSNIMKFDRALILLIDEKQQMLMPVKAVGGSEKEFRLIDDYTIPLDRTNNILARVAISGNAQIVSDVAHSSLRKENLILSNFHPKSFVALPLIARNRVIGVMAAERLKGLDNFTANDLSFVMNFANQIAISLENARLVENMKESFVSSILSLSSALEAKDAYTRGHSLRVSEYATIIARTMGLDEDAIDSIRLMALMHDIGKIGVPDHIINKPSQLTDDELKIIKRHPHVSLTIIEPLLENNPALSFIESHHERYDGTGYPDGLSGREIPIEASIIAVADTYDAMTSNRPYRTVRTPDQAIQEIRINAGSQFCPDVVQAFLKCAESFAEIDGLPERDPMNKN